MLKPPFSIADINECCSELRHRLKHNEMRCLLRAINEEGTRHEEAERIGIGQTY